MEIIEITIKILLTLVNTCAVAFICCIVTKWLQRIERKQDDLKALEEADFTRHTIVYLELLTRMKKEFLDKGFIEDAMKFQELINAECEKLKGGER